MGGVEPLQGKLLIASPTLLDPNFARSVVLICQHGADDGALGLILNRPTEAPVVEFLPDWAAHLSPPDVVCEGGPVQREAAVSLALIDGDPPDDGWVPIGEGLGLLDVSTPPWEVPGKVTALRVFSGYAGWSPSQLESELARFDWFVVTALPDDPFSVAPERLWRTVLTRQPGRLKLLTHYPPDPTLN